MLEQNTTLSRQDWDDYFMSMADHVSARSTCVRRKVGAVAINARHRVLGTGYNGSPSGMDHCTPTTCIRALNKIPSGEHPELCRAIHAEANIVLQLGEQLAGGTLYCTTQPCISCIKLLMGCGIARVVWKNPYPDEFSRQLMLEYGEIHTTNSGYTVLTKK
jgi:dCMP deaminase